MSREKPPRSARCRSFFLGIQPNRLNVHSKRPARSHFPNKDIMEHSFACPQCGEEISMVLDLSVHKQTYVEDCEVCCNPIEVSYTVSDEELAEFSARTLG